MNNLIINDYISTIKKQQSNRFKKYMTFKIQQKNNNSYSPYQNGKKYLVIMACHCNTQIRFNTIKQNLRYFAFENCDKIVINSENTGFTEQLKDITNRYNNTSYYEVPNNNLIDFGKWVYTLSNLVNYNEYDYIVLTNDSYIIHSSINHFLNLAVKHNVELFGYNDSSQVKYHFQSYLFILRKDAVPTFINRVTSPGPVINEHYDVVLNYEVNMTDWYSTYKSFLKIANHGLNVGHNIFFTNDKLYLPLKNTGLLPFTKLKRIT